MGRCFARAALGWNEKRNEKLGGDAWSGRYRSQETGETDSKLCHTVPHCDSLFAFHKRSSLVFNIV